MMTTALALVGACSPDEPEPSPTTAETSAATPTTDAPTVEPTATPTVEPTPTEVPTLTLEEQHVEEAKQTVRDYIDAFNAVAQGGYDGWYDSLSKFWGTPELAAPQEALYASLDAAGEYAEGNVTVDSLAVVEYLPDPSGTGYEQVHLTFCLDGTGQTSLAADGSDLGLNAAPRTSWRSIVQHQAGSFWNFTTLEINRDTQC